MYRIGNSALLATVKNLDSIFEEVDFEHLRICSSNIVSVGSIKTQIEAPLSKRNRSPSSEDNGVSLGVVKTFRLTNQVEGVIALALVFCEANGGSIE